MALGTGAVVAGVVGALNEMMGVVMMPTRATTPLWRLPPRILTGAF